MIKEANRSGDWMLSCVDNRVCSPSVLPWGQGQHYEVIVVVHLSGTRIWRDFRSTTKPPRSDIVITSLFAGCLPKTPSISMKRQQRGVDKQTPDRRDLVTGAGETDEHLNAGSSACSECGNR